MFKRTMASLLALSVCLGMFASCTNDKDNSSKENASSAVTTDAQDSVDNSETAVDSQLSIDEDIYKDLPVAGLTIDGKEIDTDGLVMLTVDGKDITFDQFRYYYFMIKMQLASYYGVTDDQLEDSEMFKEFLDTIVNQIKWDAVTDKLASENDIALDDEDLKTIADNVAELKEQYGDNYEKQLKLEYLTDETFQYAMEHATLYQKLNDALFAEGGKYASTADDVIKAFNDGEYIHVKSILIPYEYAAEVAESETDSEGNVTKYEDLSLNEKLTKKKTAFADLSEDEQTKLKEDAKKHADEVLKQAEADPSKFDELITEYGWDPGMETLEGYDITKETNFVQEYLDEAFKLKEDEIGFCENDSYGYFIILREKPDEAKIKENASQFIAQLDQNLAQEHYEKYLENVNVENGEYYDKLVWGSIT